MPRSLKTTLFTLFVILTMLLASLPTSSLTAQAQRHADDTSHTDTSSTPTADNHLFLPLVQQTSDLPTSPFVINSPKNGLSIAGTTIFSIQPAPPSNIASVTFRAGSTDLGTDTTATDGFQVFLDASTLPTGPTQLSATARTAQGKAATQTISVTLIANPPTSATVGTAGATLGTPSGSTIVIPPGAVQGTTNVSIAERTQQDVTARDGIDWDRLGVTFLGAIDVETTTPLSQPVGVSSVGFGNRVQPGQATVTYQLLPDQDGDGVSELVVVNGANLAPNGTIVSSPVPELTINSITVQQAGTTRTAVAPAATISGPPGTVIEFHLTGANAFSAQGNVAIFRSAVDGETAEMPGIVSPGPSDATAQVLRTIIPPLTPGAATLTLRNKSTGSTTPPVAVTIEAPGTPSRPAGVIIDEALATLSASLNSLKTQTTPDERAALGIDIDHTLQQVQALRTAYQGLAANPTPAQAQALAIIAATIENTGIVTNLQVALLQSIHPQGFCSNPNSVRDIATGTGLLGGMFLGLAGLAFFTKVFVGGVVAATAGIGALLLIGAAAAFIGLGLLCDQPDPPPQCQPSQTGGSSGGSLLRNGNRTDDNEPVPGAQPAQAGGGNITGMGAAPPPGGDGCGNAGGGSGGALAGGELAQYPVGSYIVKVFPRGGSGRPLSPFTGATDPGGYFYLPFIPEGEPFTAVALDPARGIAQTFDGVGPPTGQSIYMAFDFSRVQQQVYPIKIGDTVSNGVPQAGAGNIELPGTTDVYTFTATAGQYVSVALQQITTTLQPLKVRLQNPRGVQLFDEELRQGDTQNQVLVSSGTYTLTIGDTQSDRTGTYQFQLIGLPADRFTITTGAIISDTLPGPGAGNIESPGARDIYVFNATPGQQIFVDSLTVAATVGSVNWRLMDANGNVFFDTCLDCGDPGVQTLTLGGTYAIVVGEDRDAGTGTYAFRLWDVPPPQVFPIAIGDIISDTLPGPGAGNLESPGVRDIYTFNATAGQQVFVDSLSVVPTVGTVNWRLEDAQGTILFNSCLDCGDPGVQTLALGGTYTITVGEDRDAGTGTYAFRLWDVPPPQVFPIAIGDIISDTTPGPGAGNLESPGVRDIYTFNATAGQQVFVDSLSVVPTVGTVNWRLEDAHGTILFNSCLDCGDPGVQTLTLGGTYTITVGEDRDTGTGTYAFRLWDVPLPDSFGIAVGDIISDSVPGPGAGNIESPGVRDIYTFNATAGQQVFVDSLSVVPTIGSVNWRLEDAQGTILFDSCLDCGDPGVQTLTLGGTYTITVGEDRDTGTGTYSFQLWNVPPPDRFTITIGDTVSSGVPGAGAGNIESPGVRDIYTFNATPGQQVFIDLLSSATPLSSVNWQLSDANNTLIFDTCLGCGTPGLKTLALGGTYTLTVGEDRDRGTGSYSFRITTP